MTKSTQCPACARIREVADDVNYTVCICGEPLKFAKLGSLTNENTKDNQVILKTVFNRGVQQGRTPSVQELIESIDTKIKVNLK
ncbi:hypothetical protein [Lutibacter sp.]|uniref:hypothetical protein n=1 Tax=Lutibacter sp. TaxID=1925666 RepID=UPI0034A04585